MTESPPNLPEILAAHAQWLTRSATDQRLRLRDANSSDELGLVIAADAPQRLRAAAEAALQEGTLETRAWHTSDTIHCPGGWLIQQAGAAGRLLEFMMGPPLAGLVLGGIEAHAHFYDSNEAAIEWLRSVLERPEVQP